MPFFIVNISVTNVYDRPEFTASVVTQALLGESCEITEETDRWVRIRQWDRYEGWVHRMQGVVAEERYGPCLTVRDLSGSVKDQRDGTVLRDLTFGDQLVATAADEGFNVILPDGRAGWTDATLSASPDPKTRESVVAVARKFRGAPYVWGGKSPKGFDCSGLTQTVMQAVGISLPRDAHQQESFKQEDTISLNEAQSGDLLFFSENGHVSHVALSTGGLEFIHAQGWVREQSLDEASPRFHPTLKPLLTSVASMEREFAS